MNDAANTSEERASLPIFRPETLANNLPFRVAHPRPRFLPSSSLDSSPSSSLEEPRKEPPSLAPVDLWEALGVLGGLWGILGGPSGVLEGSRGIWYPWVSLGMWSWGLLGSLAVHGSPWGPWDA